ncbi:MAG TPA: arginine--tRNA ligase [Burkholderiales bacterium]|nr:arginine--tRNA ligase [Burkholderiales bacterium]
MPPPGIHDLKAHLASLFSRALQDIAPDATGFSVTVERPKAAEHGDFACNLALQLAKPLKRNPREIAQALVSALPPSPVIDRTEVAGAGFINLFLRPAAKRAVVRQVLERGDAYGAIDLGRGKKVQVEFVSANPTGPLHVGHGRGAADGASLANVLAAAGFDAQREYYVNDAGRQMDILALSSWLRYLELQAVVVPFPPNAYQGDYVRDMAAGIAAAHGKRYLRAAEQVMDNVPPVEQDAEAHLDALIANAKKALGGDYAYVHDYALTEQLGDCRNDLLEFGVSFEHWFSERSLFEAGHVEQVLERLQRAGHLYQQDGAMWFRSSAFGDEKDRVVRRKNGEYTYFASDIAYHVNKFERGFDLVIDVWGADHHGHIPRVKGALQALGLDPGRLTVALVQFAVLYREGKKAAMSTRAGDYVTLRQLRAEVGNDAARFFYVLRKSDQHLDFDLDLAKSQSTDNPVYYVQYAHARICSVLEKWGGYLPDLRTADLSALESEQELRLLRQLMDFPQAIEDAARELSPHLVAFYLKDLAGAFQSYYQSVPFLVEDAAVREARLALVAAIAQVIRNGLRLLGVSAPEKM